MAQRPVVDVDGCRGRGQAATIAVLPASGAWHLGSSCGACAPVRIWGWFFDLALDATLLRFHSSMEPPLEGRSCASPRAPTNTDLHAHTRRPNCHGDALGPTYYDCHYRREIGSSATLPATAGASGARSAASMFGRCGQKGKPNLVPPVWPRPALSLRFELRVSGGAGRYSNDSTVQEKQKQKQMQGLHCALLLLPLARSRSSVISKPAK
ncbi:hypothetical protein BM1_03988 [Bipolaris maydis]|nr:hypothetical protein BM1_03988 [Bipolaris maydis]